VASHSERPPSTFALYDERLLIGAVILVTIYAVVTPFAGNPLDVVLGLFVLFIAPGYGFAAVLFGARTERPLLAASLAIVVGLSVAYNGGVGLLSLLGGYGLNPSIIGVAALLPTGLGAFVQVQRRLRGSLQEPAHSVARSLRFPGFTTRQRQATWALLIASVIVFVAILYEATVVPPSHHGFSLAVTGPDGTTSTLPASGTINQTLSVLLTLRSEVSTPAAQLAVRTAVLGAGSNSTTVVPWSSPLALDGGIASSETLTLGAGSSLVVPVSFLFHHPGSYVVTFSFTSPGSPDVASTQLSEVIL
jgi:uncharacterized membrane protein